jgi:hypothetical protein
MSATEEVKKMVDAELGCVVHPDAAIPFLRLASHNEDSPIETALPPGDPDATTFSRRRGRSHVSALLWSIVTRGRGERV